MYTTYFGFREEPFSLTPTSRLFYTNPVYEEAYTRLLDGIRERRGLMVLTGEVGTGKTTLLRRLSNTLAEDPTVSVVFCYYSTLTFVDLLSFVCADLGLMRTEEGGPPEVQILRQFLRLRAQEGGTTALLIDEAQDLDDEVLENLLFLPPQSTDERLLQIILVGQQPELEQKLRQPHLGHLQQQVTLQCQLEHLKPEEVSVFIHHRLRLVGYERQDLFQPEALRLIAVYSQGIPRLINLLCDNALRAVFTASQRSVSAAVIGKVARALRLIEETAANAGATPATHERNAAALPQSPPSQTMRKEEDTLAEAFLPVWTKLARRFPRSLLWGGGVAALLAIVGLAVFTPQVDGLEKVQTLLLQFLRPQTAERGRLVVEQLSGRHHEVRPIIWGLATETPAIALLMPEPEWHTLSKDDQVSLMLYLEALIPVARADPDPYIQEFQSAPVYDVFRARVASLCADCWVIGVGHSAADQKSVLFEKVIVQGDSLWEKAYLQSRGLKASEFRAQPRTAQ